MKSRSNLVATAVLAGLAALSTPAAAYVRTTTSTGIPIAWKTPCVKIEFSLGAPPPELTAAEYLDAATQAGAAWTDSSLDGVDRCTNVSFSVESFASVAGPVGMDYHNRLIFRQDVWCREPPPTDPNEAPCYDTSALAITTVFQVRNTGEILDADLEVNAVDFTWGDYVAHPEQFVPISTHDFQGTITHEFGHVIGLDHPCLSPSSDTSSDGTLPVDNNGNPVPECSSPNLPASIAQATMYPSVGTSSGEVDLRSLSPDDMQGACDIYPYTANFVCVSPTQSQEGSSDCSYAAHPRRGAIAWVLALLALAAIRRRH